MPSESRPSGEEKGSAFARFADTLSFASGVVAGGAMLLILGIVSAEIVLRNLFGTSLMVGDELCGYLNAAVIFLGLGYTLREGGFIRVEMLYESMSRVWRMASRWCFVLVAAVFVFAMLYYTTAHLIYLYTAGVRSDGLTQMLLFLPQIPVVVGSAILLVQLLSYIFGRMHKVP